MIRRKNPTLEKIKEFDVFSKVPEPYVKQSVIGGTFSVITLCIVLYLIYAETRYFLDGKLSFQFEPDVDIDTKLLINLDITVAMPCSTIGADFIDSTQDFVRDSLKEEDTWWELSPEERAHFETLKHMNSYFSEEYHAIHELLWKSNKAAYFGNPPKRTTFLSHPPNACRIYGSFDLNKVAGHFHIVSGKVLALPRNHLHIANFMTAHDFNFTHRIHKFSFGEFSPGVIHPLEGDEKIANANMISYQYFIDVVQTDINLMLSKSKTYQYSVKNYERVIDHDRDSHGIPGIFFQYDISSLKVTVTQQKDSVIQFLIKLCATVGGVYVTNGLINMLCQAVMDFLKQMLSASSGEKTANISMHSNELKTPVNMLNISPNLDVNVLLNKS